MRGHVGSLAQISTDQVKCAQRETRTNPGPPVQAQILAWDQWPPLFAHLRHRFSWLALHPKTPEPLRNSRRQLPTPPPLPSCPTAALGFFSADAFWRLKVDDFRQMTSPIKLKASCNYLAGFEECPIPPFSPRAEWEYRGGRAAFQQAWPCLLAPHSRCPSLEQM